ncbi:MAG TPA: permease-like cell division protein FtsX [Candidatus Paceibacterota bacterium]
MATIGLKRIIRSGWVGFSRNGIISFASILVVTITLSVIAGIIFSQAILASSLNEIKNRVDITVYFKLNTSETEISNFQSALEQLPEVAKVNFVSAEQSLQNFKEKHANDYLTLQALEELDDNPLGAYMTVKALEATQYESIAKSLGSNSVLIKNSADIIDKINYNQNKAVIDRLISLMGGAKKLGFLLTLLLMIVSIIFTYNTIRLTIFFSKEEIGIMRLVGAGGFYVRGPFLVQGVIYGFISSLVTLIIFLPIAYWLGKDMTGFLGLNVFDYYLANFWQICLIIFGSGIILGVFSSFLAINKYLK